MAQQALRGGPWSGALAGAGYGGPLAGDINLPWGGVLGSGVDTETMMRQLQRATPEERMRAIVAQHAADAQAATGNVPLGMMAPAGVPSWGSLLPGGAPSEAETPAEASALQARDAAVQQGMVGGPVAGAIAAGPAVGMVRAIGGAGGAGRPPLSARAQLKSVYDAMGEQMALKPDQRIQPDPAHQVIDADYRRQPKMGDLPDLAERYPRNPDPNAPLPNGDRARPFVDSKEEIAQHIAQRIQDAGQMDAPTRYFYHSAGPIYRAAMNAGLTAKQAVQWIKDFGEYMGATSPRTQVLPNVRNATSVMAKEAAGIPHREIVGPGSGGISEKGYPMMTELNPPPGRPPGQHGMLIDAIQSGAGMDPLVNPKPSTFGPNMTGNLSGVTADTHAIRGVVQAYNRLHPGEVPKQWILKEFRSQYAKDPSVLTPDMIDDSLGSQIITRDGKKVEAQTEYPVIADIYHRVADILKVSPAEAQSMAWFGSGADTNLGSAQETVAKVLNDRISVTAQALKKTPEEVARLLFTRKIPLMSVMGAGAAGAAVTGALSGSQQQQRQRSPGT